MHGKTPRARVEAYMHEWLEVWRTACARMSGTVDFGLWRTLVEELDTRHFAPGTGSESAGSFSSTFPDHSPESERVVAVEREAGVAWVDTASSRFRGVTEHREYELREVDGDWRIARVRVMFSPPGDPLVPLAERPKILARAQRAAPLAALPRGIAPDGDALFGDGRIVKRGERSFVTSVRTLGRLRVRSGVLGVRDFTYDAFGLLPLERAIEAGDYPVDVVVASDRIAAVRVLLRPDAPIASWHPATFPGGGHHVGVDAGSIAIFDVASFLTLTHRAKARVEEALVGEAAKPPVASLISLETERDCVLVESGWGDGAYPCYWGIDQHGELAALLVDFLVLAEFLKETVRIPWRPTEPARSLEHPLLEREGVSVLVTPARGGVSMVVEGARFAHARLLGPGGDELAHTDRLGLTVSNDRREYLWPCDAAQLDALDVEVTLSTGYRNG